MTIKETLQQELDTLNEDQIKEVADFIAFIKFRSQRQRRSTSHQPINTSKIDSLQ